MASVVYFDHSATTPLDPRVAESMHRWMNGTFGNASSLHVVGREARAAVEQAREQVAELLNADPSEIVFTASGTEADNLAVIGAVEALGEERPHIVTSSIEHPAVLETCRYLQRRGVEVSYLPPQSDGIISPQTLKDALRPETRLVSIMAANNVVGTVQPVAELSDIAHEHGALFHTDAVQAAGKLPFDVRAHPIDLLSLSAHKLHGPQGVGALYVRGGVKLAPVMHGGGQEQGLRSATENVAGLVGLGRAAEIAKAEMSKEAARLVGFRDRIIDQITKAIPNAYLIGHRYRRLPGHLCLGFSGQEGEAIKLLLALDEEGICVSSGSACSAHHAAEPSYVLLAMGADPFRARGSLRITLGRFNTQEEVNRLIEILPQAVAALRLITSRTPHTANQNTL
jgi:cysteine desulfurase